MKARIFGICITVVLTMGPFQFMSALVQAQVTNSKTVTQHGMQASQSSARLPLAFEPNEGQTDKKVKFIQRTHGHTLFLTKNGALLEGSATHSRETSNMNQALPLRFRKVARATSTAVLRMELRNIFGDPNIVGVDRLPGTSNYYLGQTPENWHTSIPTFAKVRYEDVYPGIDLVYYGNESQLEYDFVVSPRANPAQIGFALSGLAAAKKMKTRITANGDLVLKAADSEFRFRRPSIYQVSANGERTRVVGGFALHGHEEIGFSIAPYDHSQTLIIDPTLSYSTFLGGSAGEGFGNDYGWYSGMATDPAGNMYLSGDSASVDFPLANPLQPVRTDGCVIARIRADGSALDYSTYFGGSNCKVVVDTSGNAFVTGLAGDDLPLLNALQSTQASLFLAKLAANGTLAFSTYLGASESEDFATAITVDNSGNPYVTGMTASCNFPTTPGAYQTLHSHLAGACLPNFDGFVTKMAADGSSLIYSTYLGGVGPNGDSQDQPYDIAVDANGSAYVTGLTASTAFPTVNAFQSVNAGHQMVFITKFSPDGSSLLYSTYLGGSQPDIGLGIAVDSSGDAYVTGISTSSDFPLKNALQGYTGCSDSFQSDASGSCKAFVSKIDTTQSGANSLVFSTYLGGTGQDEGTDIAVDRAGVYIVGDTHSFDFPITADALDKKLRAPGSGFITKLNLNGSSRVYSTYLGGGIGDLMTAAAVRTRVLNAVSSASDLYVAGFTASPDFPVTANALQPNLSGPSDFFVTKLTFQNTFSLLPNQSYTVAVFNQEAFPVTVTSVDGFSQNLIFDVTGAPAGMTVTPLHFQLNLASGGSATQTVTITSGPAVTPGTYSLQATEEVSGISQTISVTVSPSISGTSQLVSSIQAGGCISSRLVANVLIADLNLAQTFINKQQVQAAMDTYAATLVEIFGFEATKQIASTCSVGGVTFNPGAILIADIRGLMAGLKTSSAPGPVLGYVVESHDIGIPGATVNLVDANNLVLATAMTDVTGFYYFAASGLLTQGSSYSVVVTQFPTPFKSVAPASQAFTWAGTETLQNFVLK